MYIEEIPSGVRTIVGVATSIGAFVDFFAQGPMNDAVRILSFADFERQFGGLDAAQRGQLRDPAVLPERRQRSVRGAHDIARRPRIAAGGGRNRDAWTRQRAAPSCSRPPQRVPAPGATTSALDVDFATTDPAKQFNLTVSQLGVVQGQTKVLKTETFRNLEIDPAKAERRREDRERHVAARSHSSAASAGTGSVRR